MDLLIVEDDSIQIEIYQLAFGESFTVHVASSITAAVDVIKTHAISIVICEWQLETTATSALFEQIDTSHPMSLPVVIVVSDCADDAEMRKAFSAGASHYITKPYNIISFTETVLGVKHQIEIVRQMHKDNVNTREAAQTAMSQAAIYGTGMEIISALNGCYDIHSMAKTLLTTLRFNGVHAAIQYRDNDTVTSFDTDMTLCDETTEKVFSVLHSQGRIYRFGKRLMLNDTNVSLLIKRVARDDPIIYDAILDMGAKLVPAINARFNSLRQQQALNATHKDVEIAVTQIKNAVVDKAKEKAQAVKRVSEAIESSFHLLGLSEIQEAFFIKLIEKELDECDENQDISAIDETLQGVLARLAPQVDEVGTSHQDASPNESSEDPPMYQDVEFF